MVSANKVRRILRMILHCESFILKPWNYNTNRNNIRKSLVIYVTQLPGGLSLKKLKYFEVILLSIFEFSRV